MAYEIGETPPPPSFFIDDGFQIQKHCYSIRVQIQMLKIPER